MTCASDLPVLGLLAPACLALLVLLAACQGRARVAAEDRAEADLQGAPTEPRRPLAVRLMTFNLRWDGFDDGVNAWPHRRDVAYRVLREFAPDSVGTQEPTIRQIADIEAAVPALASYRFDNDPAFPRTQQVLYAKDRFERTAAGGFLLAEGANEDGTVRYCTWVHLTERETGRGYTHFNVHLDHRDLRSRELSVIRLMRQVADRENNDPFVVTGDFNTAEDSPPMQYLRGERTLTDDHGDVCTNPVPLVDTYRLLHPDAPDSGTAGGFAGRRSGAMIDHILVSAGTAGVHEAAIVHTQVDGRHPSDHFPVTAVLEWH